MRILAIATHGEAGPSTRFRVVQWAPALRQAGFSLSVKAFFSPEMTAAFYQPGRPLAKAAAVLSGTLRRWATLATLAKRADMLLIHREIFPLGRRPLWRVLEQFSGPIVYDYDDAMFLPQRTGRGLLGRLEHVDTPKRVMKLSDLVIAGNQFLADYARPYAQRVMVVPTCIDTIRFVPPRPRQADHGRALTVGWIGSYTAAKYLHGLTDVLRAVAKTVPIHLYAVGCDPLPSIEGVTVEQADWRLDREITDFQRCDVGLYPIWNDEWAKGKCAFKAIQFMACEAPVVASAVGMNRELIQDGVNGFLAATPAEWVDKLRRLLEDTALRLRLGQAGRRTIEARYSTAVHASVFTGALRGLKNERSDSVRAVNCANACATAGVEPVMM